MIIDTSNTPGVLVSVVGLKLLVVGTEMRPSPVLSSHSRVRDRMVDEN